MKFKKIYVELSDICGLHCSFCPSVKNTRGLITLSNFTIVLKKVRKYTNLITLHILGDPMNVKNLSEYLKIIKDNDLKVELTTSGIYLNNFDVLKSDVIKQINISLDAIMELDNFDLIQKYLNGVFTLCRDKNNIGNSISYDMFINLRVQNIPRNKYLLQKLSKEFNIPLNFSQNNVRLDRKVILRISNQFDWNAREKYNEEGYCYGLVEHIGVLSNGDVVPCCIDANGEIVLGNLLESSLEQILQSPRAKAIVNGFKNKILLEEKCKSCDYRLKFY